MLRLIYLTTAIVLLLIQGACAQTRFLGALCGGNGPTNFYTDEGDYKKLTGVMFRSGKRIDRVGLFYDGSKEPKAFGGTGGVWRQLKFENGEYVKSLHLHSILYKGGYRISYIKFITNKERVLEGGIKTDNITISTPEKNYRLAGLSGTHGNEVNSLQAVWYIR